MNPQAANDLAIRIAEALVPVLIDSDPIAIDAPAPEPAPEPAPPAELTLELEELEAGEDLRRTHYRYVSFTPDTPRPWRAKVARPDLRRQVDRGYCETEAEALFRVIEELNAIEDPELRTRAFDKWLAACRRKSALVAAEPGRSAYAREASR